MRTSLSLKIAIGIQLAAPFTLSLVADQPSTSDQIRHSKIFPQELVWVGATEPSAADSQILLNAISKAKADGLDQIANPLEEFIAKYSDSPWTASLRANLASYYRSIGRYSAALSHWEAAWESLKHVQGGNDKLVADQVLAEWTQLLAKLGRLTLLEKLMSENGTRQFEDMTYGRLYGNSIAAARCMKENPGTSYRCGTYAL